MVRSTSMCRAVESGMLTSMSPRTLVGAITGWLLKMAVLEPESKLEAIV